MESPRGRILQGSDAGQIDEPLLELDEELELEDELLELEELLDELEEDELLDEELLLLEDELLVFPPCPPQATMTVVKKAIEQYFRVRLVRSGVRFGMLSSRLII